MAYLGFSAHTGELSDNHEIIRVDAKNLYNTNPASPKAGGDGTSEAAPQKGKQWDPTQGKSKRGGSWSWFFFKLLLFILVAAGAYVGFTIWRSQQRGSRF